MEDCTTEIGDKTRKKEKQMKEKEEEEKLFIDGNFVLTHSKVS